MARTNNGSNWFSRASSRVLSNSPVLGRKIGDEDTTVLHILQLGLFFVIILAVTVGSVLIQWNPGQPSLEVGDISSQTFKAPRDTSYISQIRTDEARQQAYDSVDNIVKQFDSSVHDAKLAELNEFLDDVTEIRSTTLSDDEKQERIKAQAPNMADSVVSQMVDLSASSWSQIQDVARDVVDETMSREIQGDEIGNAIDRLPLLISADISNTERDVVVAMSSLFISPNVFIDDQATQAKREEARAGIEPVTVTVKKGQAIVRDGTEVTAKDIEALESLGLLETKVDWIPRLGLAGLMVILTIVLTAYLYRFNPQVWRNRQLVLIALVLIVPIIVARLILPHNEFQYVLPVAASAMLLAILFDADVAIVVSAVLALYIGVVAGVSPDLMLLYFVASIAGALVVWRAERTMTFILAGLASSLAMFIVAISLIALDNELDFVEAAETGVEVLAAGAISAAVTFMFYSVLGSIFGITTSLGLQELAHPNRPLLNRLAHEAPGTYHHSIIVSNLAEAAISRVGGDPMLARVGVLYHDIGKLEHPTFFVENQANIGNIHDGLDPQVSAQIIIDHVKHGVALARKEHVPKAIIDIIAQHHGTTRVEYFYRKALEKNPDVDPKVFTYPGPKPQTREAAVVMLADSVEASVRSMSQGGRLFDQADHTNRQQESDRLGNVVRSIIQSRIDAGQLDECDLTFRDLAIIEDSFIQILEGIYHPRVEYPPALQRTTPSSTLSPETTQPAPSQLD